MWFDVFHRTDKSDAAVEELGHLYAKTVNTLAADVYPHSMYIHSCPKDNYSPS